MQKNIFEIIKLQRKKAIIVTSAVVIIGTMINLIGITGHQGFLFRTIVLSYLIIVVLGLIITFFKKKAPLRPIIIGILISAELVMCIESIIYSCDLSQYSIIVIITNMSILAFILLVSLLAYLNYMTYVFAFITILTYTLCAYITNDKYLWELYIIFILLYGAGSLLGSMLTKGINSIIQRI